MALGLLPLEVILCNALGLLWARTCGFREVGVVVGIRGVAARTATLNKRLRPAVIITA